MTNQERYAGAAERGAAFRNFCDNQLKHGDCPNCPIYSKQPITTEECPFYWLELDETDE